MNVLHVRNLREDTKQGHYTVEFAWGPIVLEGDNAAY